MLNIVLYFFAGLGIIFLLGSVYCVWNRLKNPIPNAGQNVIVNSLQRVTLVCECKGAEERTCWFHPRGYASIISVDGSNNMIVARYHYQGNAEDPHACESGGIISFPIDNVKSLPYEAKEHVLERYKALTGTELSSTTRLWLYS
jgi:hypothetical protein